MLDSLDTLIAFVLIMLVVSLLITIAVQVAGAVLNLHGLNLAQGLKRTFAVIVPRTVDPRSDQNAKDLSNFLLKGRFLSDSFLPQWWIFKLWRHATAIRPSEVFDAIHRIAIGKEPVSNAEIRETAKNVLIALGVDAQAISGAAEEIRTAQTAGTQLSQEILNLLPETEHSRVQNSLDQVTARISAASQAVGMQMVGAAARLDDARRQFTQWSCSCQERAQQWFTMHTRILTVIFAFLAAFGMQLDTVEIFKLVSTNRLVREKLVAQAAVASNQAEKVLGNAQSVPQQAFDEWRKNLNDEKARQATASLEVTPSFSRGQLHDTVERALTNAQIQNTESLLADLDKAVEAAASHNLDVSTQTLKQVGADLDPTGFSLFVNDPGWRWHHGWGKDFGPHFLGMLFSAALLSLGAPFWYNSLKNLTSLRSAVAQSISEEKEAATKRDAAQ